MLFILACLVSFVPFAALFLWLRNGLHLGEGHQKLCDTSLRQGLLSVFPVVLASGVFQLLLNLSGIGSSSPLLREAIHNFIVLAFAEELVKYLSFRRVVRKTEYPWSWLDAACQMTIVGIGFGFLESIVYAVGSNIPTVLIRGICVPHAGYGFIVGYFYGMEHKTGRKGLRWLGFAISWLMHGLYDFSLSEEFIAVNDNLVFIPLLLAVIDIVLAVRLVFFARKARKLSTYTDPVPMQ